MNSFGWHGREPITAVSLTGLASRVSCLNSKAWLVSSFQFILDDFMLEEIYVETPIARISTVRRDRFHQVLLENSCNHMLKLTLIPTSPEKEKPVEVQLHLPTLLELLANTIEWNEAPPMKKPTPAEFVALFRSDPPQSDASQQSSERRPTVSP